MFQDVRIKEGVLAAMGGDLQEEEEETPPPQKQQPSGSKPGTTKKPEEPAKELTEEEKEAEALKQKGNELYKQKKFQEALEAYDAAIAKNPKEILYLNNKAGNSINAHRCLRSCFFHLYRKRYRVRVT